MISAGMGWTLTVVIGIGLIALFAWLWKLMKKKPVAGGTIGFFLACIAVTGFVVVPSNLYVTTGGKNCDQYWVYSSEATFEKSNGENVDIVLKQSECMLINNSDETYVIESVVYGFGFSKDMRIDPYSATVLDYSQINDFFDEEPPDEIQTESTSGFVTRKWLRTAEDYGSLDGLDGAGLDNLRNLLEERLED